MNWPVCVAIAVVILLYVLSRIGTRSKKPTSTLLRCPQISKTVPPQENDPSDTGERFDIIKERSASHVGAGIYHVVPAGSMDAKLDETLEIEGEPSGFTAPRYGVKDRDLTLARAQAFPFDSNAEVIWA